MTAALDTKWVQRNKFDKKPHPQIGCCRLEYSLRSRFKLLDWFLVARRRLASE